MVKSAQPLVSVVTPVYNGEAYIAQCIGAYWPRPIQTGDNIIVSIIEARMARSRSPRSTQRIREFVLKQIRTFSLLSPITIVPSALFHVTVNIAKLFLQTIGFSPKP